MPSHAQKRALLGAYTCDEDDAELVLTHLEYARASCGTLATAYRTAEPQQSHTCTANKAILHVILT